MALTQFQQHICRLIAQHRLDSGEAYVAGGVALNTILGAARLSRDIDLFHDTEMALTATWESDRRLLLDHGYAVEVVRERPAFVEAVVVESEDRVLMQWTCDSAYRFFPLLAHEDFGLVLHPFDLATNKVLALVGRLEVRDWIDLIACHRRLQPLGYLIWAACGKDPGLSPSFILEEARRSARYTQEEISELDFQGPLPDAALLAAEWKAAMKEADLIHATMPPESAGCCVLGKSCELFRGDSSDLANVFSKGGIVFHKGSIRGAWPTIKTEKAANHCDSLPLED